MLDRPTLNPALKDFWLAPGFRYRVLYGGRSGSKSWDAAGFAIFLSTQCTIRVLCARQFQNKISESVYTLLKIQIERFGLNSQFDIQRDRIIHKGTGSEFVFYGLWRHIDEIRGLEGIDICWVEEAHALTQAQWDILEPTIRKASSQLWLIFNPLLVTDFVWQRFVLKPPARTIKRKITYLENPFLSDTAIESAEARKDEDPEGYRHIYLGEPLQDDDQVIIKRTWIQAAIDAHKALGLDTSGRKRIGFDVADDGKDANALVEVHGIVALDLDEWHASEDELLKSASKVHARARHSGAEIDYDSIGIGAFAGAHFKALNAEIGTDVPYFRFNAAGAVVNPQKPIDPKDNKSPIAKDYYANFKAQSWWETGRRFLSTYNAVEKGAEYDPGELISISSEMPQIEQLITELSTPRKDFDKSGKMKVESKEDLAKRGIASPNLAEAFIAANAPRTAPEVTTSTELMI